VTSARDRAEIARAKLLLVLLSLSWGLAWVAIRVGLEELSPWMIRFLGYSIGVATLVAMAWLQGRRLFVPRGRIWLHLVVASLLNIALFGILGAFAQLNTDTSRVVIVVYSMPVWSSLMAWFVLRERINARVALGLALCVGGLVVLVYPAAGSLAKSATGLLLAFGCALSWAAGTVYMKWARMRGDLVAITAWQLAISAIVLGLCALMFQGVAVPGPVSLRTALAVAFLGVIGTGLAFFLWFTIVGRLSTAMASLGSLANPVVGIIGAVIILGERPSIPDIVGFALIFAAAACVLLPSREAASAR
jgi:drug/metabolite transporter (DMT)-like permease